MCFVVLLTSDTVETSIELFGVIMAAINNTIVMVQMGIPTGIGGEFVENLLSHIEGKD